MSQLQIKLSLPLILFPFILFSQSMKLWLAVSHPDVFGKVAAQFSNVMPWVQNAFEENDVLPLKVYLEICKYDLPQLMPM